eukprot:TRINITY_DN5964_c1_g1_i3.p1 TRINITY_DN5964_c1_g1~~TRINITY_DN5964_c1_g1_i3.p1  ORF type:complete len:485 (+),score=76.91 TRINITY_DN5964_c1_g1_i3:58-1512(+)
MQCWARSLAGSTLFFKKNAADLAGLKYSTISSTTQIPNDNQQINYVWKYMQQKWQKFNNSNYFKVSFSLRFPIGALVTSFGGYLQEPAYAEGDLNCNQQEIQFLQQLQQNQKLAVSLMFVMPLMQIISGVNPSQESFDSAFKILSANIAQLSFSDLTVILWGCARVGYQMDDNTLSQFKNQIISQINSANASDICGILFAFSVMGKLDEETWQKLTEKLNNFSINHFQEVDLFHLAYVGMQRASEAASGQQPEPRPSLDEVKQALGPLYRRLKDDAVKKYKEYSPIHPYIDSVYMTISFMMNRLGQFSDGDLKLPLISTQFVQNTTETTKDSRRMGQLKRALFFHWRKDELLDPWQRNLNEIVFIIQRKMAEIVKQPQDADAVLPNRKVAIFLKDEQQQKQQQIDVPSMAMTMMRYASPDTVGGGDKFVVKENVGTKNAKIRQLKQRGWKVLTIDQKMWDGLKDLDAKEAFLKQAVLEVELGLR